MLLQICSGRPKQLPKPRISGSEAESPHFEVAIPGQRIYYNSGRQIIRDASRVMFEDALKFLGAGNK